MIHGTEKGTPWLHVDLAGPAWDSNNRGTGFGVGLLVEMLRQRATVAARVMTVCTGTALLARTGLLDGRRDVS